MDVLENKQGSYRKMANFKSIHGDCMTLRHWFKSLDRRIRYNPLIEDCDTILHASCMAEMLPPYTNGNDRSPWWLYEYSLTYIDQLHTEALDVSLIITVT